MQCGYLKKSTPVIFKFPMEKHANKIKKSTTNWGNHDKKFQLGCYIFSWLSNNELMSLPESGMFIFRNCRLFLAKTVV